MSPTNTQQSIEALYKEAEATIANGGPMLAVAQSDPPGLSASQESVAAIHAEARAARSKDDALPLKQRIQNLLNEAELEWRKGETEDAGQEPVSATSEDQSDNDTPEDRVLAKTREDVTAIMADIAAAVGMVTAESNGPARHAGRSENVGAKDGPMARGNANGGSASLDNINKDDLSALITDAVKTVINEELPDLIKAAIASEKSKTGNGDKPSGSRKAAPLKAKKAPATSAGKKAKKPAGKSVAKTATTKKAVKARKTTAPKAAAAPKATRSAKTAPKKTTQTVGKTAGKTLAKTTKATSKAVAKKKPVKTSKK
ncbi:MAG: hypothetical protein VW292_02790 [Alphaproteobacteria bacterium]